jgi:hypothetical protein
MRLSARRRTELSVLLVKLFLVLLFGILGSVVAYAGPVSADLSGVRFQIAASVKANLASPQAKETYDHGTASLSVRIRISSHATGSQFYGEVTRTFSNVAILAGSAEQVFWQDEACHQRRGLPKTTVIAVAGTVATAKGRYEIQAVARRLGVLLPMDEVAAGTKLPPGDDGKRKFIGFRSETKQSFLLIDVKIYESECDLTGGANAGRK